MKLNTKLILITLQIALIPWALGGALAYLAAEQQVTNKVLNDLSAFADIQKDRLQDTLQNKEDILVLFSASPWLTTYLRDYNAQPTLLLRQKMQDLLEAPGKALGIRRVYMATVGGIVVASTDRTLIGKDIGQEEYFKIGLKHNDVSTLRRDPNGLTSQYLTGPLVSNGHVEGVMVVVTDADDIVGISRDYAGLGKTGETILSKKSGGDAVVFLTPLRFDPSAALSKIVKPSEVSLPAIHAIEGSSSVLVNQRDYRDIPVFAATRYIESVGWGVVVKMDRSEVLKPIRRLQELFLFVIFIVTLLITFIVIPVSRSVTGPINELTVLAGKIARGDLEQSIVVATQDEVGMLATAFNSMVRKLQESYATLERKVEERTRELKKKSEEARDNERAALNIAADLKTEEKKLAAEKTKAENLANDLKKFKLALDDISDMVIITDAEGVVVYANAAVEKVTGYKPEDAVGKKSGTLWKSPMPLEYYQQFWRTIKVLKKPFIGEIQNKRKNGEEYTAVLSVSPILDDHDSVLFFVGIERDITKEKAIDQAKSEFVSLASHQLRTPLTGIEWTARLFSRKERLTKEGKKYLEDIMFSVQRMNALIKLFLTATHVEVGKVQIEPQSIELVGFVKGFVASYASFCERKKLTLSFKDHPPKLDVFTDNNLLEQITRNLIDNAIDYTPSGGKIDLSLEDVEGSFVFHVRDTGIGIPEKEKAFIFTRFKRASNAMKVKPDGNGLGLYVAAQAAKLLGGEIGFESKEGEGTTFFVKIPLRFRAGTDQTQRPTAPTALFT